MNALIASPDIECPRCHRISFSWETNHGCTECHWCIRPTPVNEPYGFDVLISLRSSAGGPTTEVRRYKGNEATARRRARAVPLFKAVLAVVPLARETWLKCYGEGKL